MEEIKKKNNRNNMASMSTTSPKKKPSEQPINTSTILTWKLYDNPFYNSHQNHHNNNDQTAQNQQHSQTIAPKSLQCLQLPLSARKLAASFWDLTFFRPVMESEELESARAQIIELKTELEFERKARKKLEAMNKRLAKEASEERRARESMEGMCEELAREVSSDKSEIARMKREIDEERKMMRMSDVLREERVQMKLADAKIALEEKLSELDTQLGFRKNRHSVASFSGKFRKFVLGEKFSSFTTSSSSSSSLSMPVCEDRNNNVRANSMESIRSVYDRDDRNSIVLSGHETKQYGCNNSENILSGCNTTSLPIFQRKLVSPETENPHIKRGIKGFVEFPRVVRAIGAKNRQWGTKLECQKAQLRILLKQKSPIRSSNNNLIMS